MSHTRTSHMSNMTLHIAFQPDIGIRPPRRLPIMLHFLLFLANSSPLGEWHTFGMTLNENFGVME